MLPGRFMSGRRVGDLQRIPATDRASDHCWRPLSEVRDADDHFRPGTLFPPKSPSPKEARHPERWKARMLECRAALQICLKSEVGSERFGGRCDIRWVAKRQTPQFNGVPARLGAGTRCPGCKVGELSRPLPAGACPRRCVDHPGRCGLRFPESPHARGKPVDKFSANKNNVNKVCVMVQRTG